MADTPTDYPKERRPRLTVAALIELLKGFDQSLPVVVDGYEYGYLTPEEPALIQLVAAEEGLHGGMFGDFQDADGASPDPVAVYLSRMGGDR